MKYIIFLVKHHDGFCLYDSKLTDYKSTGRESAWKVDVMKEIADACHEVGLKLFLYYSQPDWHHPDYLTENHDRYIRYLHGQIRELLTNYGRIDGLWFDNLRPVKAETARLWDAENLFKMARSIQPHLIINNRCGLPGDFDTPEQRIGRLHVERPWESCITLGTQWSWKPDDQIKSLKECIDILVTCAARGGNLALNTNPMPDGRIEPRQVKRFHEIGRWMKKYGESIYGTTASPFEKLPWGRCTAKPGKLYLHVFDWPNNGELLVPLSRQDVQVAYLLTHKNRAELLMDSDDKGNLVVTVPRKAPDNIDTVVLLEMEAEPVITQQAKDGSVNLKASNAVVRGANARYESGGGKDNIGYWTNPDDYVIWRFNVTKTGTFEAEITFACANGSGGSKYTISITGQDLAGTVKDTGGWTSFVTEKIGKLKIGKVDTHILSLKPKTMPRGAVMNLKSVNLVPINK
jgi:alpha-L-fucosidase